jgi:hypothetical protein
MADKLIPINFAFQSYQARSGLASAEQVVNMYGEINPPESPSKVSIYRTPGTTVWLELNEFNPIYGMVVLGENLYVVCGVSFYQVTPAKTAILKGEMGTSPGRVMMTENGLQVTILTEAGIAYYYDVDTDTFAIINDPEFEDSNSITTLDGYTISTEKDSQTFQWSENKQTESWLGLDFAAAEAESDNLTVGLNYNRQLLLIGTRTIEVYVNTGDPIFQFQRLDGALIKSGTAAKYSAVADLAGIFWLDTNEKVVYQATNYQPKRISTFGIEKMLNDMETLEDAFAFVYVQAGHRFLVMTFPTEEKTICYDITQDLWHERSSINPVTNRAGQWLANCHIAYGGKQLIGDANTGTIYELDLNAYTENGTKMLLKAVSATQFDNYNWDSLGRFVLFMDTGTGIVTGQGSDPQVMFRSSKDGGKTWSNELWQPLGEMGNYCTEIWWEQVEHGRNFLAEIRVSDPVNIAITGAYLQVNQGRP